MRIALAATIAISLMVALFVDSRGDADCDIQITSARVYGANPNELPHVGDPYTIRVDYVVRGWPASKFRVHFSIANQEGDYRDLTAKDGDSFTWIWTAISGFDGPLPWSVEVDPDGVTGDSDVSNNSYAGTFEPIYPEVGIEYYDPKVYDASQTFWVDFEPGQGVVHSLIAWFGKPTTEGFQTVLSSTPPPGAQEVRTEPFGQPVWEWRRKDFAPNSFTLVHRFQISVSKSRVNPYILRRVRWSDYENLPAEIEPYLNDETENQPYAEEISQFVRSVLPESEEASVAPYDAARTLFTAVIRRLKSKKTGAKKSGLLDSDREDCGHYANVYVSCVRAIGIPARLDAGCWTNADDGHGWHVWCEVYFPGHGWMLCDPSEASNCDKTGQYAADFGYVPNGNVRCAITRGGDHRTSYFQIPFLQLVNWTHSATGVKEKSGTVNSFTTGPFSAPARERGPRIICPKSSLLLALETEIKKPDYALIARVGQPDAGMPTFYVALTEKPPSGKLRPIARALVEFLQSKLPSGEAMATFDVQGREVLRARWRAASQRVVLEEVR